MLRKIINPILFLPLALCITSQHYILSEPKDFFDAVLEDNEKWYNGIINVRVNKTHIRLL